MILYPHNTRSFFIYYTTYIKHRPICVCNAPPYVEYLIKIEPIFNIPKSFNIKFYIAIAWSVGLLRFMFHVHFFIVIMDVSFALFSTPFGLKDPHPPPQSKCHPSIVAHGYLNWFVTLVAAKREHMAGGWCHNGSVGEKMDASIQYFTRMFASSLCWAQNMSLWHAFDVIQTR